MCEKCKELDDRIGHYRRLATQVSDQATLESIELLIQKSEMDKKALHPDQS